eukprot:5928775-Lingulodinium_polyedra.AAC.1
MGVRAAQAHHAKWARPPRGVPGGPRKPRTIAPGPGGMRSANGGRRGACIALAGHCNRPPERR